MDPDYNLSRLGYPGELARFLNLLADVVDANDELVLTRDGTPVAVVVNADELDLLRRQVADLSVSGSDEAASLRRPDP